MLLFRAEDKVFNLETLEGAQVSGDSITLTFPDGYFNFTGDTAKRVQAAIDSHTINLTPGWKPVPAASVPVSDPSSPPAPSPDPTSTASSPAADSSTPAAPLAASSITTSTDAPGGDSGSIAANDASAPAVAADPVTSQ